MAIRGPYKGRTAEYRKARDLRSEGKGYNTIAQEVAVSPGTVRKWVIDIRVNRKEAHRRAMDERVASCPSELSSKAAIRQWLIRSRGNRCEECGLEEWLGQPVVVETHHVDGRTRNNSPENLLLLCPNCHSQTSSWRKQKNARVAKR